MQNMKTINNQQFILCWSSNSQQYASNIKTQFSIIPGPFPAIHVHKNRLELGDLHQRHLLGKEVADAGSVFFEKKLPRKCLKNSGYVIMAVYVRVRGGYYLVKSLEVWEKCCIFAV